MTRPLVEGGTFLLDALAAHVDSSGGDAAHPVIGESRSRCRRGRQERLAAWRRFSECRSPNVVNPEFHSGALLDALFRLLRVRQRLAARTDENVLSGSGQRPHGLNERHHLVAKRELVRFPALGNGNEPQALFEVDVRPSRRPASLRRTPVRKSNLKYVAGVKSYSCTKASFLDPVNTETPSPAHGQGDGQVIRGDRPRNGEVGDAQIR